MLIIRGRSLHDTGLFGYKIIDFILTLYCILMITTRQLMILTGSYVWESGTHKRLFTIKDTAS